MIRVLAWFLRAFVACATVVALVAATQPRTEDAVCWADVDAEEDAECDSDGEGESESEGESSEESESADALDARGLAPGADATSPRGPPRLGGPKLAVVAQLGAAGRAEDEFTRSLHRPPAS